MEFLSFGYRETLADSLWLRVIQDFDTCDRPVDRSKKEPCNNSWVFHMLDSITDLAPQYRIAYVDGGTNLDILLRDYEGAKRIFEKGLLAFPDYWSLEYRAAYFYIFEQKDPEKAAHLLTKAYQDGGPKWLPLLAGKIMSEAGRGEMAIKILTDVLSQNVDDDTHRLIEARIKKIESQLESHQTVNPDE